MKELLLPRMYAASWEGDVVAGQQHIRQYISQHTEQSVVCGMYPAHNTYVT